MAPNEFDPRTLLDPDRLVEGFIVTADGRLYRMVDPTKAEQEPTDCIAIGPVLPELYCVVYRRGGTQNFKWHRTLAVTRDEVHKAFDNVCRMGYTCHVENFFSSLAVGLPESFDPEFPLETDWH